MRHLVIFFICKSELSENIGDVGAASMFYKKKNSNNSEIRN